MATFKLRSAPAWGFGLQINFGPNVLGWVAEAFAAIKAAKIWTVKVGAKSQRQRKPAKLLNLWASVEFGPENSCAEEAKKLFLCGPFKGFFL